MICAHCKSQVPEDALFCPVCGRPVTSRQTPTHAWPPRSVAGKRRKKKKAARKGLIGALILVVVALAVAGAGLWLSLWHDKAPAADTHPDTVQEATNNALVYAVSDEMMAVVEEKTTVAVVSQDESTATLRIVAPDLSSLIADLPAEDAEALTVQLTDILKNGEYTSVEKTVTVPAVSVEGRMEIIYTKEYLDAVSGGMLTLMDALLEGREP